MKDNEKWELLERYDDLFRLVISCDFNDLSCSSHKMEIINHIF